MKPRIIGPLVLTMAMVNCSKQQPGVELAGTGGQATVAPSASRGPQTGRVLAGPEPDTEIEPGTLPTPEDFEEEAERKITVQNLEAELDQLEKEIGD